jgi:hypothetical protein
MRHWIGMILAVVMAGAVFFCGAWGYLRLARFSALGGQHLQLPAGGGSLTSDHRVLIALAAVAGTGLLAGILIAAPRISPLAAGVPGLLLLGWTGLYLVSVRRAADLIPLRSATFGTGFEAMLFNGILGTAGIAMIIPMFVPSRWRARTISHGQTAADGEFLTMLAGSDRGETAEEPAPARWADEPAQASRIPTAADLPASFTSGQSVSRPPSPGRRFPDPPQGPAFGG